MNGIALYFKLISMSLKAQIEYRFSFIAQVFGHFLVTGVEFFALAGLFSRFGNFRGFSLWEGAVFFGFMNAVFAVADGITRGFDIFGNLVQAGDFDRILLRPRSTVLQLLGHELTLRRIGRLALGIGLLTAGLLHTVHISPLPGIVLLLWSAAGAVALFTGILMMQATICFWTVQSLEIMNILTYGGVETGQYPMSIYAKEFRRFFTFVIPLACVSYYPLLTLLKRTGDAGAPAYIGWITPAAGFLFLFLGRILWEFGVRRYKSTGS